MGEYDYRSRSTAFDRRDMQIQPYTGPPQARSGYFNDFETSSKRKNKKSSSSGKKWCFSFSDPEFQRKKRTASYKVYAVEGKVKGTFRNGLRWLKSSSCAKVVSWW